MIAIHDILQNKVSLDSQAARAFLDHVSNLPQGVVERSTSIDAHSILEQKEEFQPLQNIQKTIVENNVYLALLGMINPPEFTTTIKIEAEIARERAEKIAKHIEQEIFDPNMDILEQVYETAEPTAQSTAGIVSKPPAAPQAQSVPTKAAHTTPPTPQKAIHHEVPDRGSDVPSWSASAAVPHKPTPATVPHKPTPPAVPHKKDLTVVPHKPAPTTAKEQVLQTPAGPNTDPADIFKKRLEQPVHNPVEENEMSETGKVVGNSNPSTKEQIANDPYKETIE